MQYNAYPIYFWLSELCIFISISQDFKPLMYTVDLILHFYINFIQKSYSDIIMLYGDILKKSLEIDI